MIVYKLLYIFTFLLSVFSLDKKYRINTTIPLFLVFIILFVGFRYDTPDFFTYAAIYYRTEFSDFAFPFYNEIGGTTGNEFVYASWSALLNELDIPLTFFYLSIALISISIKFYVFKKLSPYFYISVLIYISSYLFTDMSQIRNGLASSIVLISVFFIYKKNWIAYTILIFIASGIQVFAIVALPLYWIYNFLFKDKYIFLSIFVLLIAISFSVDIIGLIVNYLSGIMFPQMSEKLIGYYSNPERYSVNQYGIGNFFNIFLVLFLIIKSDKIKEYNSYTHVFISYMAFAVLLYNYFSDFGIVCYRSLELLMLLSLCIMLPIIIKISSKKYKLLIFLGVVSLTIFRLSQSLGHAHPYQFNFIT